MSDLRIEADTLTERVRKRKSSFGIDSNMYAPPPAHVLGGLVGGEIECITYGKYVLHISLSSGNRISIACPFRHGDPKTITNSQIWTFPMSESDLIRAIGSAIADVASDADGTLYIRLSGGDVIILYANDPMYEAYTLLVDGREYVV